MELVDDRDPRVKFQPDGAWVMAGGEYEHSGTTHGTASGNAAMVFQFSGLSWIDVTFLLVVSVVPYCAILPFFMNLLSVNLITCQQCKNKEG